MKSEDELNDAIVLTQVERVLNCLLVGCQNMKYEHTKECLEITNKIMTPFVDKNF